MAKLNQIVAVVNGKKTKCKNELTELYKNLQKADLFAGLSRTYNAFEEDGEKLPAETTLVKQNSTDVLLGAKRTLSELLDVVATQDVTNCKAKADIIVDEKVIVSDVPVTYLMFLEKQLIDLHTFVNTLPELDSAFDWNYDTNRNCYVTSPVESNRTKKVSHFKVAYEATKEHPAQVVQVVEDVNVGKFNTVKFSGAVPRKEKQELVERVEKLQDAVKFAREQANSVDVENVAVAKPILNYVFGTQS